MHGDSLAAPPHSHLMFFFLRVLTMKTIVALIFPDILLLQCPLPFPTVHLFFFNVDRSLYQPEGPEQHLLSLKEPTQMSITLYPFYLRPILQTSSDIAWVERIHFLIPQPLPDSGVCLHHSTEIALGLFNKLGIFFKLNFIYCSRMWASHGMCIEVRGPSYVVWRINSLA